MKEAVNHPSHYNQSGKKECIVEMREKFGDLAVEHFCLLNAYKYLYRCNAKNGVEDLKKAIWYLDYITENYTLSNYIYNEIENMLAQAEKELKK